VTRFAYHRPSSPAEAAEIRAAYPAGESTVIGGGTLVVPAFTRGDVVAPNAIDMAWTGLDYVTDTSTGPRVGIMASYQDLLASPLAAIRLPLLCQVAGGITGGYQIRHQGTVGGALCAARPSSDALAALVALEAAVTVRGPGGRRTLPVSDFIRGAERTALAPVEIAEELTFPRSVPERHGYYKLKLAESSWPIATGAAVLYLADNGTVDSLRLVLGAIAERPVTVPLEDIVRGMPPTSALVAPCADRAVRFATATWTDILATSEYRQQVVGPVARRALAAALKERPAP
jgi:aerobic carbon-monoxide dehydrogenase medium subunit